MNDIRLCKVWIEYTNGKEVDLEVWLDFDSSIEDQVYMSFNPLDPDYPQIANFKWREAQGEQHDNTRRV